MPGLDLRACAAALALFSPSAAAAEQPAPPPRILVYTVSAGYEHEVAHRPAPDQLCLVESALVERGKRTGLYEAVPSRDAASFEADSLAGFQGVFFYTTGELPLSAAQRDALFAWIEAGGAFIGSHCATDTFYKDERYGLMLGGYFDGHPWHENVSILVEDGAHPSTRHLGSSFEIVDEIYQFKAPYERARNHGLLKLDPATTDLKRAGVNRADKDFAVSWTREQQRGRVFYTSLGHRPEVWRDERFLRHLDGGIAWATRREELLADAPRVPMPKAAEGFAVDLVLDSPRILWPSAVHALDDGSLLVGEDRMDMPGPTDKPVDRLMRVSRAADGTWSSSVYADGLYAIFGLESLGDTVYVMNMPHLTALRDTDGDGKADVRQEILTTLGPPAPGWPGGFNDHIVSGLKMGMDGYLYVAIGDKGVPECVGRDGRRLTLRGGGVVRVRPDGHELELVAPGLRNILDVAIDARGEMYTYDNTDDGLGWWTRVTHVVGGAAYGYPHDYRSRPELVRPCILDQGGGSPCGNLVYREAAWPEPWKSGAYFAEWGKGVVRRFDFDDRGATHGVKGYTDLVSAGEAQAFRPLDVAESPDGRWLWISDWNYNGWTAPVEAGRLWRVRRADDDGRNSSAMRPLPADDKQLLGVLEEPSFRRRLRAQQALAEGGTMRTVLDIVDYLEGPAADRAKAHAWCALEELSRYGTVQEDDQRTRRLQLWRTTDRLLGLELPETHAWIARAVARRADAPLHVAAALLASPDAIVRREAAAALANPAFAERGAERDEHLAEALRREQDEWVRHALQRAIWRGKLAPSFAAVGEASCRLLIDGLRDRTDAAAIDRLAGFVASEAAPGLRAHALLALQEDAFGEVPWDGKWWSIDPARRPPPARTVVHEATPRALAAIRGALRDPQAEVQIAALRAVARLADGEAAAEVRRLVERAAAPAARIEALRTLGLVKDVQAAPLLAAAARSDDPAVREAAIEAAVALGAHVPQALQVLAALVLDDAAPTALQVQAARALAKSGDAATAEALAARARKGASEARVASIEALGRVAREQRAADLRALLGDSDKRVAVAAVREVGALRLAEDHPALLALMGDVQLRSSVVEALARRPRVEALDAYLAGLSDPDATARDAARRAIESLRDEARPLLEERHRAGRIEPRALATVRSVYADFAPLRDWTLLGPWPRRGAPDPAATTVAALSAAAKAGGLKVVDHRSDAQHGFVDLDAVVASKQDVSALAWTTVASSKARRAKVRLGSDDDATVWVNGEKVHENLVDRGWTAGADQFEIDLRAGRNDLCLRVGQNGGGWSFSVELEGEGSGPLYEDAAVVSDASAQYVQAVAALAGDPRRGREVFRRESGPMCLRCHVVNGEGGQVGPELSDVALKYDRAEIVRSILQPSARVAEAYVTTSFELDDGTIVHGMVRGEEAGEIVLYDANGAERRLEAKSVVDRAASKTSLMPEGLALLLSEQEFADLVAYLGTLKMPAHR